MENKSNLLMTEQPIVINKKLAEIIGLNEAIVLQQIEYWININRKAEKESSLHDNVYWTYNTVQEWREQFPFWSYDTVKRTLNKLRKKEILITNRYNKEGYDRTLWYRINYKKLNELEEDFYSNSAECPNEISCDIEEEKTPKALKTNNSAECPNAIVQNAPTNTKDYTEITTSSSSSNDEILKMEFENNICELKKTTTDKLNFYIEKFDKDFIATIINYCCETNIKSFAGFKTVIDSYISKNIFTKEDLLLDIEKFRRNKKQRRDKKNSNASTKKYNNKNNNFVDGVKKDSFNSYKQREYDYDELEKRLLNRKDELLDVEKNKNNDFVASKLKELEEI